MVISTFKGPKSLVKEKAEANKKPYSYIKKVCMQYT